MNAMHTDLATIANIEALYFRLYGPDEASETGGPYLVCLDVGIVSASARNYRGRTLHARAVMDDFGTLTIVRDWL